MADPGALFAAHHHRLFRYLCRALGDADAARDLTQDVFLRVTRSTTIPAGDGSAWLFQIARNLVLDRYRARARSPELSEPQQVATRPASQDVQVAVNQALALLEPMDRDVFLMREVAGLGYEEIAAACELSPDAVRSRIHRTRLRLRSQLAAPIAMTRDVAVGSGTYED